MTNSSGFTIIELLIYLGLFAIIIGGGMMATYQIIESTQRTNEKVIIIEDANFILAKINWALNGATSADVSVSTTPPGMSVGSNDFELEDDILKLNTEALNSSFVRIEEVSGTDMFEADSEKITITFTVNGQQFNDTKYFR